MTETTRLAPGDKAPTFTLPDADGNKVSLADYRGRRVVVYFYPAASTPGCTKQACDFRDNHGSFLKAGAEVLGVSNDSVASHDKFAAHHSLPFTLLSDPGGDVKRAYDVILT